MYLSIAIPGVVTHWASCTVVTGRPCVWMDGCGIRKAETRRGGNGRGHCLLLVMALSLKAEPVTVFT